MDVKAAIRYLFVGFLVGIAFVLPGVSGAVLLVVFGLYERLVYVISDLRHRLRDNLFLVLTLAIGMAISTILFSSSYLKIPDEYEGVVLLAFVGLILGQIPDVYKIARKDGEPVKRNYVIWFIIGLAVMVAFLFLTDGGFTQIAFEHSLEGGVMSLVSGAVLAISGVVPGISGTSLLLAFGTFDATMDVLGNLDVVLLLPMLLGAFIGLICIAKLMEMLLIKHYYPTYWMILGLTVGSVILIIPQIDSDVNILLGIVAFIAGLAVALLFSYFGKLVPEDHD